MTPSLQRCTLPPTLVALSPGLAASAADATDLGPRLERLLRAGLPGLVLREPQLDDRPFLDLALNLRERFPDAWLCLHDRVHLVAAANAQAVHLGWRSLAPREARALLPENVAIGFSSHAGDAAQQCNGADYAFLSPLHPIDKPHAFAALGPDGLSREVAARPMPTWALGGVRPEDAAAVAGAGARGVAVLSGLHAAADPIRALASYLATTAEHWPT